MLTTLPLCPRFVYNDGTAVDLHLSLPLRPWTVGSAGVGGSDVSGAGVPAAFQIRRDSLWHLTLRFREREWGNVERLLAHLQGAGSVTFYPDRLLSASHTLYLVSPAMGEEVTPRPGDEPSTQELDITVRPTTATSVVRRRYYSRALWRHSAGDDARHIAFTRTGAIGARRNFEGNLEQMPANVLRTNWRLRNGVLQPYTLLERPGANVFQRSEEMDNAYWTKAQSSVNPNQRNGPDGVASLDELIEDTSTSNHTIQRALTGVTANAPYAFSRFFRAGARTRVLMKVQDTATPANFYQSFFDLATGLADNSSAGGTGALIGVEVEDWGGGLYRCSISGSVGNSVTAVTAVAFMVSTGTTVSYLGNGVSSFFTGYAQFEDNVREASSYIPTTTASAAREAERFQDVLPYTLRQLMDMGGGTFYVDKIEGQAPNWVAEGGASPRILHFGNSTGAALILFKNQTTDGYRVSHRFSSSPTVEVLSTVDLNPSRLDRIQLAAQFHPDGSVQLHGRKNGTTDATGTQSAAQAAGAMTSQAIQLNDAGGTGVSGRGIQEYRDSIVFQGVLDIDECEREARAS